MARSQRPRVRELRDVYLLVGECIELGGDPLAWRAHMLDGLARILGGRLAMLGEMPLDQARGTRSRTPFGMLGGAVTKHDSELLRDFVVAWLPQFDVLGGRTLAIDFPVVAWIRRQQVGTVEGHRSKLDNHHSRTIETDATLQAAITHPDVGKMIVELHRPLGDKEFCRRERRLLQLFLIEIRQQLGQRLALRDQQRVARLSPRLRQVLAALQEGDSEKQIARRLAISEHTVHEHVKRLHRAMHAHSRGELLAASLAYRPTHGDWERCLPACRRNDPNATIE